MDYTVRRILEIVRIKVHDALREYGRPEIRVRKIEANVLQGEILDVSVVKPPGGQRTSVDSRPFDYLASRSA